MSGLSSDSPAPGFRMLVWVAVPAAEAVAISLRFDTGTVDPGRRWTAWLLAHSSLVLRLGIAGATASLLILLGSPGDPLWRQAAALRSPRRSWPFLLGHFAAFAAFYRMTAFLLEGGSRLPAEGGRWVAAWSALGAVSLGFWGAAALPPTCWARLARRGLGLVGRGAAIGSAACAAGMALEWSWRPLGAATLWLVAALLAPACREVVCRPADAVVGTPTFVVTIAPECSGHEGIGLIWVFLGSYLWLFRRELRFPRALLLLPLGTALVWLTNAVRIAALVAVGTWGSPAVAMGGFHSQSGWLAFNAVALGLVVATRRRPAGAAADRSPSAAAFLAPLLAIIATAMVTGAFTAGADRFYGLRVLAGVAVLWFYRREPTGLHPTWSWTAVGLGAAGALLWAAMAPHPAATPTTTAAALAGVPWGWVAPWLLVRVVGAVVVAPLAEELAFRGYLARRLMAADFRTIPPGRLSWPAVLLSSALFGALHRRWFAGTLAGCLYAVAFRRRGELGDAVLAHATTNALLLAYIATTGDWSVWG